MKNFAMWLVATVVFLLPLCAPAQTASSIVEHASFDVIGDAAGIGIGEALVANIYHHGGARNNPSTLSGVHGAGVYYGYRDMSFGSLINPVLYNAGAYAATGFGAIGIDYSRFDLGEFQRTFENGTNGGVYQAYNQTVAVTYASPRIGQVVVGASLKAYSDRNLVLIGDSTLFDVSAIVGDIGVLYSSEGLSGQAGYNDRLDLGASFQNIGPPATDGTAGVELRLLRYLRLGAAYRMTFTGDDSTRILRLLASFEYRALLDPKMRSGTSAGAEALVFDIVSLRIGTNLQWYDNIYGRYGVPAFRYGIGVNIPFEKIGFAVPVVLTADYARVDVLWRAGLTGESMKVQHAFSIGAMYAYDPF